jgi:16S rRNA (cytidine1402-2'-O)-methyltransferase
VVEVKSLYLVGPVGEWQDLTLRAREVLCRVGLLVVQVPERVRPQLEQVGVQVRLLASGHEEAVERILAALAEGEVAWAIARIDDLQGPGQRLARALLDQGVELVSVPAGSTMVRALASSGLPADRFTALGRLPFSREMRVALWQRFGRDAITLVCEAPAEALGEILGEIVTHLGDRRIAIGQGDDVWRGPASEAEPLGWNGCVTLAIAGAGSVPDWSRDRVQDEVRALLAAGTSPRDTARQVAQRSGWPRRRVYELALLVSRDEL